MGGVMWPRPPPRSETPPTARLRVGFSHSSAAAWEVCFCSGERVHTLFSRFHPFPLEPFSPRNEDVDVEDVAFNNPAQKRHVEVGHSVQGGGPLGGRRGPERWARAGETLREAQRRRSRRTWTQEGKLRAQEEGGASISCCWLCADL